MKHFLLLLLLLNYFNSKSQTTYYFKSHEICNISSDSKEYNCKTTSGTQVFEYFKIDPEISIEFKFVNEKDTYKSKWDNNMTKHILNGYSYTVFDSDYKDGNGMNATLFFDNNNRLFLLAVMIMKNNIMVSTKLYP